MLCLISGRSVRTPAKEVGRAYSLSKRGRAVFWRKTELLEARRLDLSARLLYF